MTGTDPNAFGPPPILVLEHPREKRHKCTVAILKGREGLAFRSVEETEGLDFHGALLLHAGADIELTPADAGRTLVLVDASWRWAERAARKIPIERRRLPRLETAYPRSSKLFRDPPGGLASAEAIFVVHAVFGRYEPTWLDGYRWKEDFLRVNADAIEDLLRRGREKDRKGESS